MNHGVAPKRIALIVMDERVRLQLHAILREAGFDVHIFKCADDFSVYHESSTVSFDAFVEDIRPGGDGVKNLKRIREIPMYRSVAYVARVTGGSIRTEVTLAGGIPIDMQHTLLHIASTLKQELGLHTE